MTKFLLNFGVLLNTEGSENFKLDAETSYDPENLYKPGLKVGIDTMLIVGDALLCTWRAEPVDFLMFANFLLWFFVWNLEIEGNFEIETSEKVVDGENMYM